MAHPCASKNPPSFCTRKAKKRKSSTKCACPSGWTAKGIMCKKGRKMKRSSCAATLGGRERKAKRKSR